MKGTECITWLEKKYGNLSNIIDYNKFIGKEVKIAYYNNDYWAIEYNNEVLLDEEVLDLLLEEERLNNRG